MTTQRQQQINDFLGAQGYGAAQLLPLAGDASFRRYIRVLHRHQSMMLMDAPPQKESVDRYLAVAAMLYDRGYSAPAVLAQDVASGLLLLEDFGDDSFTRLLAADPQPEHEYYAAAVDLLADWHRRGPEFQSTGLAPYDEALLMQEVRLFAEWFLPRALGEARAAELAPGYLALWQGLLRGHAPDCAQFVHRDYHADNLMWLPGREGTRRVGLLDFQDAVLGDAAYDLVSLLEDARRDLAPGMAEAMLERYLAASAAPREAFLRRYALLGAQRNSKIVGIFVRLLVRDGKPHYLKLLPRVWAHLERDLAHPALAPLAEWMDRHVPAACRGELAATAGAA